MAHLQSGGFASISKRLLLTVCLATSAPLLTPQFRSTLNDLLNNARIVCAECVSWRN